MGAQFAQLKQTQYICRNKVKRDMEAKELMIGDWVLIGNNHIRVTSLQEGKDYVEAQPIPLTAEILEKNGWRYNNIPFVQGWEQYGLLLYTGGNGYRINCGTNIALIIDSVHELQHALRLCGIDKEIVL